MSLLLAESETQRMQRTLVQEQLQLKSSVSPQPMQPALDVAAEFHSYCHGHFCRWLRLQSTFGIKILK